MTYEELVKNHAGSLVEKLVTEVINKDYIEVHFEEEDKEEWAVAGLLHDADYEAFPDEHPAIIVRKLREMGEEKIAHAISAHYTKWQVPYETLLDKALLACDELTGFIVACCQVRPDGIGFDVPQHGEEVVIFLHGEALGSARRDGCRSCRGSAGGSG